MKMIPLSVPCLQGNEWQYVKECLDTGWVSSAGQFVNRFEDDICEFTGARHAVACVNGTAALQVGLRIVGVQPEDEVIVPTITFIAPVNAVKYCGASPVFMDCDDFYNIDVEKTIQFLRDETHYFDGYCWNRKTGKRISAIVPVHVFGNAVDMAKLLVECKERNIKIVEDATESLGTTYSAGDLSGYHTATVGDVGCFSFNGNKIITTGGGGMLVTKNAELAEHARYLTTQAKDDPVRYIHHEIGYNFRMTNVQAAIGVAQLEQLPDFIVAKNKIYNKYTKMVADIPGLNIAPTPEYAHSNHWMIALQVDEALYGEDREALYERLRESRIETRPLWHPNHLQQPYRKYQQYKIEKACKLHEITLNVPCSSALSEAEVDDVVQALAINSILENKSAQAL